MQKFINLLLEDVNSSSRKILLKCHKVFITQDTIHKQEYSTKNITSYIACYCSNHIVKSNRQDIENEK